MKNIRLLFAIGLLAMLTACGTTTTATDTSNSSTRRGDTQTTRTTTNTSTSTTRSTKVSGTRGKSNMENSTLEQVKAKEEAYTAYTQKMATDLSLTEAQMKSFNTSWNSEKAKYTRSNPNKEITLYERVEAQDKIFKNILNESDFAKYQAWVRENPGNFK